ncbi:MAG: PQQ-binding-like beta-propeller repeat protein, partial [Acidobacteria bacterium]|nr:PQQ-binding-like beta-propeller repeat protein [Acidobacteriota bacterium]
DGDQVILAVIGSSWGEHSRPLHRLFSFDKRDGKILWTSSPGGAVADLNTYSTPVVTVAGGQRLVIGGFADGGVYALKARTGEKVWGFQLSKRGLNVSPVVRGDTVYIAHSEENIDEGVLGRTVGLDAATGKEKWRSPHSVGYASPLVHGDVLYVVDNSANLFALDADSGEEKWKYSLGTVGKGSPVWADGKIYATEVNGNFLIVKPGAEGATPLDSDHITMPEGRFAEIYGSPAVAYGRVYFATENGLFCLGDKSAPFRADAGEPVMLQEEAPAADAAPAWLQVVPAEVLAKSGDSVSFELRAFDAKGRPLGTVDGEWSQTGLAGRLEGSTLWTETGAANRVGKVVAKAGGLEASARVRVIGPLPFEEDFEGIEEGKAPTTWIGVGIKAKVKQIEGVGKVLVKDRPPVGVPRAAFYVGTPDMSGYTVQADVLGTQQGRRRPDMGLIDSGYILELQGNHQRLQIRSWTAELRMAETLDFAWDPDTWYTMKMRVDQQPGKAVVLGKVWKRGEAEPKDWTIRAEDPHPVLSGSPGIQGYSPVDIYFDNLKVTVSQ